MELNQLMYKQLLHTCILCVVDLLPVLCYENLHRSPNEFMFNILFVLQLKENPVTVVPLASAGEAPRGSPKRVRTLAGGKSSVDRLRI